MIELRGLTAPRPGEVVAEKYRIDGALGEGGMGVVYSATHVVSGKKFALKWLRGDLVNDARAAQRMVREAQASARIQHPNVVDVHDVGSHRGSVYLVMEHLYGESLAAAIDRGRLEPATAIHLMMPALRGVAAAHRLGIVHRDLKPGNIFLCRGPDDSPREAKVLDLGISKVIAPDGNLLQSLTRSGSMLGTPSYMSPEQAEDPKEVDHCTDVYSLGVILFEALTGSLPFTATRVNALLVEITQGTPLALRALRPELPADLEAVITRAMARSRLDRYPDVATFAHALEAFAPGTAFHTDPTGGHSIPVRAAREVRSELETNLDQNDAFVDARAATEIGPNMTRARPPGPPVRPRR